jgi:hypothetical protein
VQAVRGGAAVSEDEQPSGWPDGLMRLLIIEWPKTAVVMDGDTISGMTPSVHEINLIDWKTGLPLVTVTEMHLIMSFENGAIIAELTMLTDGEGLPLIATEPKQLLVESLDENGEIRTGVFRWTIAAMRIAK